MQFLTNMTQINSEQQTAFLSTGLDAQTLDTDN